MGKIILFIGNFLVAMMFGWDIMDFYFFHGINIIRDEVNREFIIWVGFLTSLISSVYFMDSYLSKRNARQNIALRKSIPAGGE
jgi:hypothetical protein